MSNLNGDMEGIVASLTDALRRAEWAEQQAREAHDAASANVKQIKAMLKVAGVEEEAKPKAKAKAKESKPNRVNDQTRRVVLDAIHAYIESGQRVIERVPHSFTVATLEPFSHGVHSSSVRTAVSNLREEGIIRACGLVSGTPRKAPMAYVLGEGNEASE